MSSSGPHAPALTSDQAGAADRLAGERFGLPIEWLMEAAGWQVARHCREATAVVCGRGNNGGDGLAAARHLHSWGRLVSVCCAERALLRGAPGRQAAVLESLGVTIRPELDLGDATLVLDAIFGTGLSRPPAGVHAMWIEAINRAGRPVVAIDLPSGLDADSGRAHSPAIRADQTVTLGLPKTGLLTGDGPGLAGEVWVVDIGIPREVYAAVGVEVPAGLFSKEDRVRLPAILR
ncbi:MAG: NAD(P)H-hydrate epimerase [Candidatus Dormibacteraceae bacterium]